MYAISILDTPSEYIKATNSLLLNIIWKKTKLNEKLCLLIIVTEVLRATNIETYTPKRYQDPVLRAWLEMFSTPKRYQDPVLWVSREVFSTLKRFQDPVLWVWLELFSTPKRYQF